MSKPSSAFGHQIVHRSQLPTELWPRYPVSCSNGLRCPGVHQITEKATWREGTFTTRVGSPALYWAGYSYISGRKGHTSSRDLYFCQPCGEKFAKRHGLTLLQEATS